MSSDYDFDDEEEYDTDEFDDEDIDPYDADGELDTMFPEGYDPDSDGDIFDE